MPRFDDGIVNMSELIRAMAESLVNEIMDAQADDACEAGNRRNGYRERKLATSVGTISLRIPKLRSGTYFSEDLISRYSRVDRAVRSAVSEMVANGVSTRKVKRVAQSMGIDRMSASQVSRTCSSLDESVADLQERDLSDVSYPYIWLDATYIKRRDAGRMQSTALVTAIDTETYDGWKSILLSLRARRIDGVICVTSDAHEGLKRAIQEVFPGAARQRCIVHLMPTPPATTRQKRGAVLDIRKAVFAKRDTKLVHGLYQLATEQIEGFCPKAAEVLVMSAVDQLEYEPALFLAERVEEPFGYHLGLCAACIEDLEDGGGIFIARRCDFS